MNEDVSTKNIGYIQNEVVGYCRIFYRHIRK